MPEDKPLSYSFPPVAETDAEILILGSMPGAESLRQQRYYAHPRNAFWPIMQAIFAVDASADYQQRCHALTTKKVAVWDVLKACHRPGSLDQHIAPDTIEANDFNQFFQRHCHIRAIYFNGGKAEAIFKRTVYPALLPAYQTLPLIRLPSTSPAHAALALEQKIAQWRALIQP